MGQIVLKQVSCQKALDEFVISSYKNHTDASRQTRKQDTKVGVFSSMDLNSAQAPNGGGLYFEQGEYEVEVTGIKGINTRGKGPMFLGETVILESNCEKLPVGMRPSYSQLTQGNAADVAPQNIKMFLVACAGLNLFDAKDAKAIAAQDWNAFRETALSDDQPLKGSRIHVTAILSKNKAGGPFTRLTFTPGKDLSLFQRKLAEEARK